MSNGAPDIPEMIPLVAAYLSHYTKRVTILMRIPRANQITHRDRYERLSKKIPPGTAKDYYTALLRAVNIILGPQLPEADRILIKSTPEAASISVDGGQTAIITPDYFRITTDPAKVTSTTLLIGTHAFTATLDGYIPTTANITLALGPERQFTFQLAEIPPPPEPDRILIKSTPEAASISVDGAQPAITTPDYFFITADPAEVTTTTLLIGTHAFTATLDGYKTVTANITLSLGRPDRTFTFQLAQLPPGPEYSILIESIPEGASISVDGAQPAITTPDYFGITADPQEVTTTTLLIGTHAFTANLAGYTPVTANLTLALVKGRIFTFQLEQIPPPAAEVNITANVTGAKIYVDNFFTTRLTPYAFIIEDNIPQTYIRPGNRVIKLEKTGYQTKTKQITVVKDQSQTVYFQLIPGDEPPPPPPPEYKLTITANVPTPAIHVDNTNTGKTAPFSFIKGDGPLSTHINPGTRTIKLLKADYNTLEETHNITDDQDQSIHFTMTPKDGPPPENGPDLDALSRVLDAAHQLIEEVEQAITDLPPA